MVRFVTTDARLISFLRVFNGVCASSVRYRVPTYFLLDARALIPIKAAHVVVRARLAPLHDSLLAWERVAILLFFRFELATLEVEARPRVLIGVIRPF